MPNPEINMHIKKLLSINVVFQKRDVKIQLILAKTTFRKTVILQQMLCNLRNLKYNDFE